MKELTAIRTFFEDDGGRNVTVQELKALTNEERHELAVLAAEVFGEELDEPKGRS